MSTVILEMKYYVIQKVVDYDDPTQLFWDGLFDTTVFINDDPQKYQTQEQAENDLKREIRSRNFKEGEWVVREITVMYSIT